MFDPENPTLHWAVKEVVGTGVLEVVDLVVVLVVERDEVVWVSEVDVRVLEVDVRVSEVVVREREVDVSLVEVVLLVEVSTVEVVREVLVDLVDVEIGLIVVLALAVEVGLIVELLILTVVPAALVDVETRVAVFVVGCSKTTVDVRPVEELLLTVLELLLVVVTLTSIGTKLPDELSPPGHVRFPNIAFPLSESKK